MAKYHTAIRIFEEDFLNYYFACARTRVCVHVHMSTLMCHDEGACISQRTAYSSYLPYGFWGLNSDYSA